MADAYFCRASSAFKGYCITQTQIDTLRAYIDGTSTTEEAVSLLVSYPEASSSPVETKQRLGGLWTLLNDTAVNLEFSQPQVIKIIKHIRTLPVRPELKGEGEDFIDLDDGFYWRELTDWGINWADAFNSKSNKVTCFKLQFLVRHKLDYSTADLEPFQATVLSFLTRPARHKRSAVHVNNAGIVPVGIRRV